MNTINEFCRRYRMSRRTYYRRLRFGQVPAGIKVGKSVLIEDHAIEEWLRTVRGVVKGVEDTGPI
jgi:predicted DNA-binding transcriptional regulator AlpA